MKTPEDSTAEADKVVAGILGEPSTTETPEGPTDDGVRPTQKEVELPSKEKKPRKPKDDNLVPMSEIPFEDRRAFYIALQYADGRVTWRLPIGDPKLDKQLGVPPQFVVFKSRGGAELEVADAILKRWFDTNRSPSPDAYMVMAHRVNLFLQLQSYAGMPFDLPAPGEDGAYDAGAVEEYIKTSMRRMGNLAYSTALMRLSEFERRVTSCVLAIKDGSFLKAGR